MTRVSSALRESVSSRAQRRCEYCQTALFNPRVDAWQAHFQLSDSLIEGLTPIGRANATLLRFNLPGLLMERALLISSGRYPV